MQDARHKLYSEINTTSVTDLLDTFTVGTTTYPAIFNNMVVPATFQDLTKLIQIYPISAYGSGDYRPQSFQVSCHSTSEASAIEIAQAVYDVINRVFITDGYIKATIQPPIYDNDSWLVPVEAEIKR